MKRFMAIGLVAVLAGCGEQVGDAAGAAAIDGVDMVRHVGQLSADDMGGRAPGSPGEDKTIAYLSQQFAEAGLEPGNGDSWTQEVPLMKITASPAMALTIVPAMAGVTPDADADTSVGETSDTAAEQPAAGDGAAAESAGNVDGESSKGLVFEYGEEMIAFSRRLQPNISVENSPLVFAGYGIVAPEYDWDDYAGLDAEGKTVVVLVNDPGFATQDPELFNGNAMTYYGRWSYKYEEAARHGAAGVIIVHEDDAAGYPWEVVTGSWSGPQFDLAGEADEYRLPLRAWITRDAAERLFGAAGMDFSAAKEMALKRDFQARPLDQNVSVNIVNTIEKITSNNVLAILHGSKRPEETVIYTAHWDHLGTDPENTSDPVYNGAVDNATGLAGLLELAEAFGSQSPPDRSIVFLAVTAEESGLLGSRWYAEHPVYPLAETAGVINMDSMNVYGPTSDVVIVGAGSSELEEYVARAAERQGREIVPEEHPERGYYYRSDHFNFAKQGVPALYAESGSQFVGENAAEAAKRAAAYTEQNYHKPSDEYADWWNLEGAIQDLQLYYEIGKELANTREFPAWYEGNEFRAIREETAALRQDQ